jgi:hypothetical protein
MSWIKLTVLGSSWDLQIGQKAKTKVEDEAKDGENQANGLLNHVYAKKGRGEQSMDKLGNLLYNTRYP